MRGTERCVNWRFLRPLYSTCVVTWDDAYTKPPRETRCKGINFQCDRPQGYRVLQSQTPPGYIPPTDVLTVVECPRLLIRGAQHPSSTMQKPFAHMFSNRLWAPRTSYEVVKSKTDDGVREEGRHCAHCHCHSPGFRQAGASRVALVTGIFLITVFLFLLFAVSLESYLSPVNEALRQTVFFCRLYAAEHMILSQLIGDAAPILQEREIPSYTTMMNGTLFSPPHPSMARQEPSPENDAEWRQYINTTIFQLSRDEVIKLGKDPNTAARLDPEYWGVGDDVYYGKFDISHVC